MKLTLLILILFLSFSCTITKRQHNYGWHMEWKNPVQAKKSTIHNEIVSDQKVALQVHPEGQSSFNGINTADQTPDSVVGMNRVADNFAEPKYFTADNDEDTLKKTTAAQKQKSKQAESPYPNKTLTKKERSQQVFIFFLLTCLAVSLCLLTGALGILLFVTYLERVIGFLPILLLGLGCTALIYAAFVCIFRVVTPKFPAKKVFSTYRDRSRYSWKLAFRMALIALLFVFVFVLIFIFLFAF